MSWQLWAVCRNSFELWVRINYQFQDFTRPTLQRFAELRPVTQKVRSAGVVRSRWHWPPET